MWATSNDRQEGSLTFCFLDFILAAKFIYQIAATAVFFTDNSTQLPWAEDMPFSKNPPGLQRQVGTAETSNFID